jgi:hypothetical protein
MSAGDLPLLATCWPETETVEMSADMTANINSGDRSRIRVVSEKCVDAFQSW